MFIILAELIIMVVKFFIKFIIVLIFMMMFIIISKFMIIFKEIIAIITIDNIVIIAIGYVYINKYFISKSTICTLLFFY